MKYNYKVRVLEARGKKKLRIDLPSDMELISVFLAYDVQSRPESVNESLEKVIVGNSKYERWNGNICGLEITKEITKVYDNLAEDGIGKACEIETVELRELIDIWMHELQEFKKSK